MHAAHRMNRDRLVARLVDEIDRQMRLLKIDPKGEADQVVNAMVKWAPSVWAQLALLAGAPPSDRGTTVSDDSIDEVISVFVRRARGVAAPERQAS